MSVIFNKASVDEEAIADGVTVRRLVTPERVKSNHVQTEILTLAPGAETEISVGAKDLAWGHIIEGTATLSGTTGIHPLSTDHFLMLPPGFSGKLTSKDGARLFRATVPDAARFDPAFASNPPAFRCVDWTEEPVLDSEHDARKRIYMVTPKLSGTDVVKGEMILYPAGTEAPNHHHEGAEHFMYVLRAARSIFSTTRRIGSRKATPSTSSRTSATTSSTTATARWRSSSISCRGNSRRSGPITRRCAPGTRQAEISGVENRAAKSPPTARWTRSATCEAGQPSSPFSPLIPDSVARSAIA